MREDDSSDETNKRTWFRGVNGTDLRMIDIVRDFAVGVMFVVLIGLFLFAISGVWPPLVVVESGSMEPHMSKGDLVFVLEEHRFAPGTSIEGTGVVTYRCAASHDTYRKFGGYGDVIVFDSNGDGGTPIIHRAHFWVNGSENWYAKANPNYLDGQSCKAIDNCPAPHSGFITKGDHNPTYDQIEGRSDPVRPKWIRGAAEVRVPLLGHVRLAYADLRKEIGSLVR